MGINVNNTAASGSATVSFPVLGLGILTTVVFIILKLTSVITWDWFFIWLPLIIGIGWSIFTFILALIAFLVIAAAIGGSSVRRSRSRINRSNFGSSGSISGDGRDFFTQNRNRNR